MRQQCDAIVSMVNESPGGKIAANRLSPKRGGRSAATRITRRKVEPPSTPLTVSPVTSADEWSPLSAGTSRSTALRKRMNS